MFMSDLFALSEEIIDQGKTDIPTNRINLELSVLLDDIAIVEAFSHSIVFRTSEGLVVIDTGNEQVGGGIVEAIRGWSRDRFNTIIYTHGHVDHVGGSGAFFRDASAASHPAMQVIAHENLPKRLRRYQQTSGYNLAINRRQFGKLFEGKMTVVGEQQFLPADTVFPTTTYSQQVSFEVGDTRFHLYHDKGETDDHTWAWVPKYRAICCGDLVIWNYPNAGNPQKVQRYPLEWSEALKRMAALEADYLLPNHGLPIRGRERIQTVLLDIARALDLVIEQTLERMNAGETLSEIVEGLKWPTELMAKPYLRPLYDEPEFVVRNIWRMYGGWYDGNPAHLRPASDRALAAEMSALAGGALQLARRAYDLSKEGDLRLAAHLAEAAALAEPDNPEVHKIRAEVYTGIRKDATSLMAKGIYRTAAIESKSKAEGS
jgi:alkyl sulfatase BDS1-like metallo-beta-lactamase superfamily hydrolase